MAAPPAPPAPGLLALVQSQTETVRYNATPKFPRKWITSNDEVLDYIKTIDEYAQQYDELTVLQKYRKIVTTMPEEIQSMFSLWRINKAAVAAPPVAPNALRDIPNIKEWMITTWSPPTNREQLLKPIKSLRYRKNEDPTFVTHRFITTLTRISDNITLLNNNLPVGAMPITAITNQEIFDFWMNIFYHNNNSSLGTVNAIVMKEIKKADPQDLAAITALQPTLKTKCNPRLSKGPAPFIHYDKKGQPRTANPTRKRANPNHPNQQPPQKRVRRSPLTPQERRKISCRKGANCRYRGCGFQHVTQHCCKYGTTCRDRRCTKVHTSYHNNNRNKSTTPCTRCRRTGHKRVQCTHQTDVNGTVIGPHLVCNRCKYYNHMASKCRSTNVNPQPMYPQKSQRPQQNQRPVYDPSGRQRQPPRAPQVANQNALALREQIQQTQEMLANQMDAYNQMVASNPALALLKPCPRQ